MVNRKKSFTLIEIIVVVAVIGLTLPAVFAIIFSILQQQIKIYRLSEVKRQGDYVLSNLENTIRNSAMEIYSDEALSSANEKCASSGTSYPSPDNGEEFYFKNQFGQWFQFLVFDTEYQIASQSAVLTKIYLTTSKVRMEDFSISCSRSARYSPPIVTVSFNICYNNNNSCTSARHEEVASMTYKTQIKLRSY